MIADDDRDGRKMCTTVERFARSTVRVEVDEKTVPYAGDGQANDSPTAAAARLDTLCLFKHLSHRAQCRPQLQSSVSQT